MSNYAEHSRIKSGHFFLKAQSKKIETYLYLMFIGNYCICTAIIFCNFL